LNHCPLSHVWDFSRIFVSQLLVAFSADFSPELPGSLTALSPFRPHPDICSSVQGFVNSDCRIASRNSMFSKGVRSAPDSKDNIIVLLMSTL